MLTSALTDKIGTSSRIACHQLRIQYSSRVLLLLLLSVILKSSTKVKTDLHIAVLKKLMTYCNFKEIEEFYGKECY